MARRRAPCPCQPEFRWEWTAPLYDDEPPHFDCPKNDNEKLLNAQYDWLVNRSDEAWADLWQMSLPIVKRMVCKQCRSKGFRPNAEQVEDMVFCAMEYIFNRYDYYRQQYGRDYVVKRSFIAALWDAVRHAVDYAPKNELAVTYVDYDILVALADERGYEDEDEALLLAGL